MHERNIFQVPPDFAKLGEKYKFLASHLTLDSKGVTKLNFKDPAALRALTKALLLENFGLDIQIPDNVLVPTVPLRLNYILWIEDLLCRYCGWSLDVTASEDTIRGIDIGTGASAIYAFLGAKKNKWIMYGTEVNQQSVEIARENVKCNKLQELISIVPSQSSDALMFSGCISSDTPDGFFTFTMCNPPFFASDEETDSIKMGRFSSDHQPLRKPPSTTKTGSNVELIAEGGELCFIMRMVDESSRVAQKVKIFSTMVGIKRHMKPLLSYLQSKNIFNYTCTEFVQGKTMRWGLAWSHYPEIVLVPDQPDVVGLFPKFSPLVDFEDLITQYLNDLKLDYLSKKSVYLEFIARKNTWSNQRRKRREMERLKNQCVLDGSSDTNTIPCEKSPKLEKSTNDRVPTSNTPNESTNELVHCLVRFERDGIDAKLFMWDRGSLLGKDGVNQINQYLKNRYTRDLSNSDSLLFDTSTLVPKNT